MSVASWSHRWSQLARAAGLDLAEPAVLALSGGADSVFLLHVLAASPERPLCGAVHVDHGLRGEASREDARFCARLCSRLGVPFHLRTLTLDPDGPGLEARAREARYRVLLEEARALGSHVLLTGHHADDALETVLMRWARGTSLGGLSGLRARLALKLAPGPVIQVVRPLLGMRREEVRRLLGDAGLAWREDASNSDPRFTRNRLRQILLPRLEALGGRSTLDNLRAFSAAVEELERHLAGATAHIAWQPPAHSAATRPRWQARLGGTLPRRSLTRLPTALRRRALWRLVLEATGRAPRRKLLERVLEDLRIGRCATHALPRGFVLHLRSSELLCVPPPVHGAPAPPPRQLRLQFHAARACAHGTLQQGALELSVPGEVQLPDGRSIAAEWLEREPLEPPPRLRHEVELDALSAGVDLAVRFARAGDRFHALGSPGSRPLGRFLCDAGVPREERGGVLLVLAGAEIAWVAGLRPAERFRVRPETRRRLRLRLLDASGEPSTSTQPEPESARPSLVLQGHFWASSPPAAACSGT